MLPFARLRRLFAGFALAAMLLGALAPGVSRALAAQRSGAAGFEVCTSEGPRWITPAQAEPAAPAAAPQEFQAADAPPGSPSALSPDHCPFCLLVAERLGPPPAASMHFFNADSGLAPSDAQALFFPAIPLCVASARGPPAGA